MQRQGSLDFAAYKLPLKRGATLEERTLHSENMLARALNLQTTVAFVGSGCSIPYGYPSWQEFTSGIITATRDAVEGKGGFGDAKRLENFLKIVDQGVSGSNNQATWMFFIGACQEMLRDLEPGKKPSQIEVYQRYFRETFGRRRKNPETRDVYSHILNLPIQRFVTTNYDCELELALHQGRKILWKRFGIAEEPKVLLDGNGPSPASDLQFAQAFSRPWPLSFTQRLTEYDRIALLPLAKVRGNDNMVFHCHGRYDDPESLIASEADYQSWYLGLEEERVAFRQGFELLLSTNPLLFIGYSMSDEDLLRPLRSLGALDRSRKVSRPIFALLEQKGPVDEHYHEALFERYGLHVISYRVDPNASSEERSQELCNKLKEIEVQWKGAAAEWGKKPKVKRPCAFAAKPKPHLVIKAATPVPVGHMVEDLQKLAETHKGVLGLIGPSGCGKSLYALQLISAVQKHPKRFNFQGTFFWNSHYANGFLACLDSAIAYLDPEGRTAGKSRSERILECLRKDRYLIIFDGCERLVHKTAPSLGRSYSALFSRLLRAFSDPKSESLVLLVGRLWPIELDQNTEVEDRVRRLAIERVRSADLRDRAKQYRLDSPLAHLLNSDPDREAAVSAFCSLIGGHNYALQLVDHCLERVTDTLSDLCDFNAQLAHRAPDQRVRAIIEMALERLIDKKGSPNMKFLENLTFFLNPVCDATLEICYQQSHGLSVPIAPGSPLSPPAEELRQKFIHDDILFPILGRRKEVSGYSAHAMIRNYFFASRQGIASDPLPDFGLSAFTSDHLTVDPGKERHEQIKMLFEALLELGERTLDLSERSTDSAVREVSLNEARDLCRDAFGLLRNHMETGTAPRWCETYDQYIVFGLRIWQLLKRTSSGLWTYAEHHELAALAEDNDAPLYIGELAWLYNDIAATLNVAGQLQDAYSVWEQTYEVSRLIEGMEAAGDYQLETLLSLVHTFIEMGRLPRAQRYLEEADLLSRRGDCEDYRSRILGFRGLLAHLRGNLPEADRLYQKCLKKLKPGTNLRAQSFFMKNLANLKMAVDDLEKAGRLVRASRSLAESADLLDLAIYAHIGEGHLLASRKEHAKARSEFSAVLRRAQRMGARKQEAEILGTLARLALNQGDAEGARILALKALSLANELSLGLRMTNSLVVLGVATCHAGQRALGVAYLKVAKRLADEQEYWHRGREAEGELQGLGEL